MKEENIVLEETFDGGLKYSLYSNFKKWSEAFLELMDNSVSDRIPGKKLVIEINNSRKYLRITNKGGYGMGLKELKVAFDWGKIKERMSHDIGAYSQGGKSAMGYLGRSMVIITSADKSHEVYRIEDFDLHDYKLKRYNVITSSTDDIEGRVEIKVSGLRRSIKDDELEELVSETYRPLIEDGSIEVFLNSEKIKTQPFPLDTEFKIEKVTFKTARGEKSSMVRGWIGRLTPRSGTKGGMKCYKLGRLICDREFFGPKDASYKQTLNFLFGEIHLDHIPATTNKTDFDRDSDEWSEVQQNMETILKPHIDELLGREIREPSDEEREGCKKAKDLAEELLRMKKIDFEGKSLGNMFASGQKQREDKSDSETQKTTAPTRQNNPATPPPKDASGKRKRIREFMEWELRDMDESIRSKIEETENKNKKLVINNLFPGYIVAKRHQLYLLETAAIQLSIPDEKEEKITPAEYIERFDDLYAFFCSHLNEAEEKLKSKKNK